jgi:hypothetical protein
MKWIVLAIVAFIAIYSFLTLRYRKPGPAYQPFHDAKEKATVHRLESAGFRRITATVERPAEAGAAIPLAHGTIATVQDAPGGVPAELKETLIDQPRLADRFEKVRATAQTSALLPYTIQFSCGLTDHKQLLSGAYVYLKEDEIAVVPEFEPIEGDLLARTKDSLVQVTIPSGTLPSGTYRVTLVGARACATWNLQVH